MNNLPKVVTHLCPEYDFNPNLLIACPMACHHVVPPRHLVSIMDRNDWRLVAISTVDW